MSFLESLLKMVSSFFEYMKLQDTTIKNPCTSIQNLIILNNGEIKPVNIVGFRDESNPDMWNDLIVINIGNKIIVCNATTDPGKYYTENPLHEGGAAHLINGYYSEIWVNGLHRGKYDALVQRGKKIKVWRDKNKNYKNDDNNEYIKLSGINLHHGNSKKTIERASAGCQVIRLKKIFFDIIENIKQTGQRAFDYLLTDIENCPPEIMNLKKNKWY